MNTYRAFVLSALLTVGLSAQPAPEATSPLQSTMAAFTVVSTDEGEALEPAVNIQPGNVIEYHIVYRNIADRPLKEIKAGALVPESTVYIDGSATGAGSKALEFSIDGGKTFAVPPIHYTKTNEDGSTDEAIATPEMYNNIRWTIPVLNAGAEKTLVYRVRVQ